MNLRAVDLNLLVILDALLDEAHVTRAATRLGLSQPAMSNALERCRILFADPLLERSKEGMRLSPKAQLLRPLLKNNLAQIQQLVLPEQPDLTVLKQQVKLGMSDAVASLICSSLYQRVAEQAPGLDLLILPWHGSEQTLDALRQGDLDLAVSVFTDLSPSFTSVELMQQQYLVVMCKDHPAAIHFDLQQWLCYPHLMVSGRGQAYSSLDQKLAEQGLKRRVAVVVPSFLLIPDLLRHSELISLLPESSLPANWQQDFVCFTPPLALDPFPLHLASHVRRQHDPAVQLVSQLIRQIVSNQLQSSGA
ncbi:LysR substrate-binding domain-containing protein [Rheinheimera soli]|uniref:DNA-binding transcriptional LysR family regulator n=1 Tax=Rheinheimera soli TaxID=443616 RepID=A0ABU1VYU0_9GAMM|nr:LysR substrate-binding domain-containing protein [Rheinheimera soli]MDR7120868.1 DNA-binding transcriptional LysR family regulator [Rheinheimera soli]